MFQWISETAEKVLLSWTVCLYAGMTWFHIAHLVLLSVYIEHIEHKKSGEGTNKWTNSLNVRRITLSPCVQIPCTASPWWSLTLHLPTWNDRVWASEPLSVLSTMATHQNMSQWIDEKRSMSATAAPSPLQQNDPPYPRLYVRFMYVLLYESELPAVSSNNLYPLANSPLLLDIIKLYSVWFTPWKGLLRAGYTRKQKSECRVLFLGCLWNIPCSYKPRRSAALWNILRAIVD